MFRRKVKDPHGRKWTLGRHWLPRRKRFTRADLRDAAPDGNFAGQLSSGAQLPPGHR